MSKNEVNSLDRIADTLKEMAEAQGAGIPEPTVEDAGKVLMVGEDGKWKLAEIPSEDPSENAENDASDSEPAE